MIIKRFTYLFVTILLLSMTMAALSCKHKAGQSYSPWGTPMNEDGTPAAADSLHSSFSLDDIISHGEMILLTMTGPDTYYDYHGYGMGDQYFLCESFTSQLGVKLRVEVCRDTMEMVSRLEKGEGDVIITPGTPSKNNGSKELSQLGRCNAGWYLMSQNTSLKDAIDKWYKPEMLTMVKKKQETYLAGGGIVRHVYAPVLNQGKGVISQYDGLFQKYAPMAGLDWRLIAAQCYQESCFDPNAHSFAGACGLMQTMPATAAQFGFSKEDMYNPEISVKCGVLEMQKLIKSYGEISVPLERLCFVLAAYNAGRGHVADAQALVRKYGGNPYHWADVKAYILKLQNAEYYNDPVVKHGYVRGWETAGYVDKILARWGQYRGYAVNVNTVSNYTSGQGGVFDKNAIPHPSSKPNRFTR